MEGTAAPAAPAAPESSSPVGNGVGGADRQVGPTRTTSDPAPREPKPDAPATPKVKIRRGGKDVEHDPSELPKLLSDDYEHEFSGPEGKALKLKWPDITRRVQLSEGAMDKMREAAKERAELAQAREWGKQNVPEYLQAHLGVEDFDQFIIDNAKKMVARQEQLAELQARDPYEYQRTVAKQATEAANNRLAWERHQQEQQAQAREVSERTARNVAQVAEGLRAVGLKGSDSDIDLAEKVWKEYSEVGYKLTLQDLAALTKQKKLDNIRAELDAFDQDGFFELAGDERRAKFREWEMIAAKGAKKDARAAEKPLERDHTPAPSKAGLTERDLDKRFGKLTGPVGAMR
jgi:hypothetical protein